MIGWIKSKLGLSKKEAPKRERDPFRIPVVNISNTRIGTGSDGYYVFTDGIVLYPVHTSIKELRNASDRLVTFRSRTKPVITLVRTECSWS